MRPRPDELDDNHACWIDEAAPYEPAAAAARRCRGRRRGHRRRLHRRLHRLAPEPALPRSARRPARGPRARQRRQRPQRRPGAQLDQWRRADDPAQIAARLRGDPRRHRPRRPSWSTADRLDAGFARDGCLEVYTSAAHAPTAAQRASSALAAAGVPVEWLAGTRCGVHGAHGAVRDPDRRAGQRRRAAARLAPDPARARRRGLRADAGAGGRRGRDRRACARRTAACAPAPSCSPPTPTRRRSATSAPASCRCTRTSSPPRRCRPTPGRALGWGAPGGLQRRSRPHRLRLPHRRRTPAVRRRRQRRLRLPLRRQRTVARPPAATRAPSTPSSAVCATTFPPRRRRRSRTAGAARSPSPSTASARWACAARTATSTTRSATAATASPSRTLAGRVLGDLYSGEHAPWSDLPFYQKRLPRLPPEPLRWLGYHAYTTSHRPLAAPPLNAQESPRRDDTAPRAPGVQRRGQEWITSRDDRAWCRRRRRAESISARVMISGGAMAMRSRMPRTMTPSRATERDRPGAEHRRRLQRRLAAARQQIDGADQLVAADLAHRRVAREGVQLLLEVRADVVAHALDQLLASRGSRDWRGRRRWRPGGRCR